MSDQLSLWGQKLMTVKEVADITGVPERTIHNAIDRVLPGVKKNGFITMLTEEQVAIVSSEFKRAHNSDLASTGKVITTDLEMRQKAAEVMAWLMRDNEQLKAALAIAAPKAEIADRIATADGLKSLAEVGKINGIGPVKIFEVLSSRGILYRKLKSWLPYQCYIDQGYFSVKEGTYKVLGQDVLYSTTYVTGKGELWLARRLFAESAS